MLYANFNKKSRQESNGNGHHGTLQGSFQSNQESPQRHLSDGPANFGTRQDVFEGSWGLNNHHNHEALQESNQRRYEPLPRTSGTNPSQAQGGSRYLGGIPQESAQMLNNFSGAQDSSVPFHPRDDQGTDGYREDQYQNLLSVIRESTINSQQFHNQKDKDPFNTGLQRYNRASHNILEWLLQLEQVLSNKNVDNKREVLLERLSMAASSLLSARHNPALLSYEQLQLTLSQIFMGRQAYKSYEHYFREETFRQDTDIETFLAEMIGKWTQYRFALVAEKRPQGQKRISWNISWKCCQRRPTSKQR